MKRLYIVTISAALLSAGALIPLASANHSWGGYHWARTANPLTLKLGDNVTSNWDAYLALASSDWSASSVLDTTVVPGSSNPKTCKAVAGRIEVCNSKYGSTGWLGIASVWASGSHITQGTVKLNDTYFATAKYNTPAWKRLVTCQEVGHTFGLDHQDENFSNINLGTCMDYTNDPGGTLYNQLSNEHPNIHDYDELATIYEHLDTTTTASASVAGSAQDIDHGDQSSWGRSIRTSADGKGELFERDLGNNNKVFTFVVWAR